LLTPCYSLLFSLLLPAAAPPDLHPLSLHDALPICLAQRRLLVPGFRGMLPVLAMDPLAHPAPLLVSLKLAPLTDAEHETLARETDRKSTRLNYSHEWNSYSVFCLS